MTAPDPLERFSEPVRAWFSTMFAEATPPQAQGWPAIASGEHTLVLAPTGSGRWARAVVVVVVAAVGIRLQVGWVHHYLIPTAGSLLPP